MITSVRVRIKCETSKMSLRDTSPSPPLRPPSHLDAVTAPSHEHRRLFLEHVRATADQRAAQWKAYKGKLPKAKSAAELEKLRAPRAARAKERHDDWGSAESALLEARRGHIKVKRVVQRSASLAAQQTWHARNRAIARHTKAELAERKGWSEETKRSVLSAPAASRDLGSRRRARVAATLGGRGDRCAKSCDLRVAATCLRQGGPRVATTGIQVVLEPHTT